jgi:two-component system, OmpR family, alkaline phosphatase synthesis response regulator PhoP
MADKKILIVEDEAALATTLRDRLRKQGYKVQVAKDGVAGFDLAAEEPFDLIVLDLLLPGQSGLAVCEKLRERGLGTPILMLTARRQLADKVTGLKTGADDYLTKPFQMPELLARIEALIRRGSEPATKAARHQFGPLCIDFGRTEVLREGRNVPVSAKEFQLLQYFVEHRGSTLSRDVLLKEVWGYDVTPSSRTVDVHVAWLRQKLEKDPRNPQFILTVVGLGYKFVG